MLNLPDRRLQLQPLRLRRGLAQGDLLKCEVSGILIQTLWTSQMPVK